MIYHCSNKFTPPNRIQIPDKYRIFKHVRLTSATKDIGHPFFDSRFREDTEEGERNATLHHSDSQMPPIAAENPVRQTTNNAIPTEAHPPEEK